MRLPNFLIVGAAKAGTTSLHNYLSQHPDIALPRKKETFFFTGMTFKEVNRACGSYESKIISDINDYEAEFIIREEKAIGEVCGGYLYFHEQTIPNIHKYCGDAKIIIILRNPIDRAYSNYMHHVRDLCEPLSFEQALAQDTQREQENYWWGYQYRKIGLYKEQVEAYINNFSSVKVVLFEDLQRDTPSVLADLCSFLEVDQFDFNFSRKYNQSGYAKNRWLQHFMNEGSRFKTFLKKIYRPIVPRKWEDYLYFKVKELNVGKKPEMRQETREVLREYFRENIMETSELIKRDLSHWLK